MPTTVRYQTPRDIDGYDPDRLLSREQTCKAIEIMGEIAEELAGELYGHGLDYEASATFRRTEVSHDGADVDEYASDDFDNRVFELFCSKLSEDAGALGSDDRRTYQVTPRALDKLIGGDPWAAWLKSLGTDNAEHEELLDDTGILRVRVDGEEVVIEEFCSHKLHQAAWQTVVEFTDKAIADALPGIALEDPPAA